MKKFAKILMVICLAIVMTFAAAACGGLSAEEVDNKSKKLLKSYKAKSTT